MYLLTLTPHSLDAVRILVHRPFLLYPEPCGARMQTSRQICQARAEDITDRLVWLLDPARNRALVSWPFTVYAAVNSLLISWYDVSQPRATPAARETFAATVNVLRIMGRTWWAAVAKWRLGQALARAADEIRARGGEASRAAQGAAQTTFTPLTMSTPTPGHDALGRVEWASDDLFAGCSTDDFWGSLGLDFELDVADNIFGIAGDFS